MQWKPSLNVDQTLRNYSGHRFRAQQRIGVARDEF